MKRWLIPFVAASLFVGCDDEELVESGLLERPSGLAYVERVDAAGRRRGDLFVADSEAQGVRVLQTRLETRGDQVLVSTPRFVPAPTPFFRLAIPAHGFPTDLAFSQRDRLYALAPATMTLHVLDAKLAPFDASATLSGTYTNLSSLDLRSEIVQRHVGEDAVPVDVDVLPVAADIARDAVVLAFDRVTQGDGVLVWLLIEEKADGTFEIIESASRPIAGLPREIEVRSSSVTPDATAVLVASATAGPSLSVVAVMDDADRGKVLGAAAIHDAGGPITDVIDAGFAGVLALRLDRPAAMYFEGAGANIALSRQLIDTPYTPVEELADPTRRGRIDLRPSTPVAGAAGTLTVLPNLFRVLGAPTSLIDGPDTVIYIAHADARVTFLAGSPPRIAVANPAEIFHVEQLDAARPIGVGRCPSPHPPLSCTARKEIERERARDLGVDGKEPEAMCSAGVLVVDRTFGQTFRASFKGPLAHGSGGQLERTAVAGQYRLIDGGVEDFAARKVAVGDRVLAQVHLTTVCGDAAPRREVSIDGAVTAVGGVALTVVFDAGFEPLDCVEAAGIAPAERVSMAMYEVYPATDDVVLRSGGADELGTVLERVPVQPGLNGGDAAVMSTRVSLTVTAAAGFDCETRKRQVACNNAGQCGGQDCIGRDVTVGCPGICQLSCDDDDLTCPFVGLERVCSGVELQASASTVNVHDPSIPDRQRPFNPAAPDDVVFSSIRSSWFTSYPGARALAETSVSGAGVRASRYR